MAEALFEDHPLQDYLIESGDTPDMMPGGSPDFLQVDTDTNIWLPWFIIPLVEAMRKITASHRSRSATREFAERFKYVIISSSLLSASLAPPSSTSSRNPSSSVSPVPPGKWQEPPQSLGKPDSPSLWTLSLCIAPAALLQGYYLGALLILAAAKLCETNIGTDSSHGSLLQNLEALDTLIAAGNAWDSVVREAMCILEKEERTLFYGTATPSSPSSSLRVALHSTLQTTATQCDNVRQLFTPLTSAAELSQMAEMYSPLTPIKSTFSTHATYFDNPRPLSLSATPKWTAPVSPTLPTPTDKRATWNGLGPSNRVKDKRQSALATLLGENQPQSARLASTSPSTPRTFDEEEPFGIAALDLQRKRKRLTLLNGPLSATSSRFTAMQTTRHPLSLSSLNHALQAALSSKRYSASHLLALRFTEEEDETYWEDVRSVISLLTTTFEDAAARLSEALEETLQRRHLEEQPSVTASPDLEPVRPIRKRRQRSSLSSTSFAPMPSKMSKFSSHANAISSALETAQEKLEDCMNALREEPREQDQDDSAAEEASAATALQYYENVRRELGFALRELERARQPLLEVVGKADGEVADPDTPDLVKDEYDDDIPTLAHDTSDSEPSRATGFLSPPPAGLYISTLPVQPILDDATQHLLMTATSQHLPPPGIEQVYEAESNPVKFSRERSTLTREERIRLSKLRRGSEESSGSRPGSESSHFGGHGELWGPSGEVMQELRSMIWKVEERRRQSVGAVTLQSADVVPDNRPSRPLSLSSTRSPIYRTRSLSPAVPQSASISNDFPVLPIDSPPRPIGLPLPPPPHRSASPPNFESYFPPSIFTASDELDQLFESGYKSLSRRTLEPIADPESDGEDQVALGVAL